MSKRVCVIGAGSAGLTAIKACKGEGLEPVCLERTSDIGGIWNYTEEVRDGNGCVMKSTVTNTSKEFSCYSDFPFPEEFPNFMIHSKLLEYFRLYAKKFDLLRHITFNTEVLGIAKADNFEESGRWNVTIKDLKSGDVRTEVYDAILVCTGHHAVKNQPVYPGKEIFQGRTLHTCEYKDSKGFEDKTVVVVGLGNSAGDVAVELSNVASQVYLSSRRGGWVTGKIAPGGIPWDVAGITRYAELKNWWNGFEKVNAALEDQVNGYLNHDLYKLRPKHKFLGQHPTANDDLRTRILNGTVVVKPNIGQLTKNDVEFEDGTVIRNVDAIVYATGYKIGFPFIDKSIIEVDNNKTNLYKYAFPPDMNPGTLAVVGCYQPWGSVFPPAELQCRWAARVFKGVTKLPSSSEMWKDINNRHQWLANRYAKTERHTIEVDYIPFMDEIASQFGCKPNLAKLYFTDHQLFKAIYYGPCTPYQYRLEGPGKWDGARQAVLTQWDRVYKALDTRSAEGSPPKGSSSLGYIAINLIAVAGVAWAIKYKYFK